MRHDAWNAIDLSWSYYTGDSKSVSPRGSCDFGCRMKVDWGLRIRETIRSIISGFVFWVCVFEESDRTSVSRSPGFFWESLVASAIIGLIAMEKFLTSVYQNSLENLAWLGYCVTSRNIHNFALFVDLLKEEIHF